MPTTRPTTVTHQEIAERAGVSRALVTRALHRTHGARVSPATRREIVTVARQLGYRPRNVTTYNMGFVCVRQEMFMAIHHRTLVMMDQALRESHYRMLLTSLDSDDPHALREVLNAKTVDGVISACWRVGWMRHLLPPDVPWIVLADEDAVPEDVDRVTMDTSGTTEMLAQHLFEYGHRRIGLVSSPGRGGITEHGKIGLANAFLKAGFREQATSIEVETDDELARKLAPTLTQPAPLTAFIVFGTEKTVTVQNFLNVAGYRVPQDVSLVSLTDSHILGPLAPPITATTAMGIDFARRAVARLLEKIDNPATPPQHILVPSEFIPRGSVGPAPKKSGAVK